MKSEKKNTKESVLDDLKGKYLDVTYGKKPFTNYPLLLATYLIERYGIKKHSRVLDIGCGRGEYLNGFIENGLDGYGFDRDASANLICPTANLKMGSLEEVLPYEDNFFDVVFSKSVIEHFYYPENLISEINRILKPGGLIITITPDWAHNIIYFHEDFTHRTPFTLQSVNDIHQICQFKNVVSERFVQLPIVWRRPYLKFINLICRKTFPNFLKKYSKFVRFSKEIMLLTTGVK